MTKDNFCKNLIKILLVKLLGYHNYLYFICLYRIKVFKYNRLGKEFFYFLSLLPPNTVVLDIGANIGYTTYYLANIDNLLIDAFEPEKDNIEVLRKIVSKFTNVTIHPIGLGNDNGIVELVTPIINNVKAHPYIYVYQEGNSYPRDYKKDYITINKLDNISKFRYLKKPLSAVRISVQGFEYLVIRGGEKLIEKFHPIIFCEIWDAENKYAIINFLQKKNYETFVYQRGKLIAVDISSNVFGNFFFIPKRRK